MKTILEKLLSHDIWLDYLDSFKKHDTYQKDKKAFYEDYIINKKYLGIVPQILKGEFNFPVPQQHRISKINTGEKRIIYAYPREEQLVLKILNRALMGSGLPLSPLCHSFQRGKSAKSAFHQILSHTSLNGKYCLHIDIKNYFNSIDINLLLPKLPGIIKGDKPLMGLLKSILMEERAVFNGKVITCLEKGVMAGTPLSPLLSNIFLTDLDEYFRNENVAYARYSDDIILFTDKRKIKIYLKYIENYLHENRLEINYNKFSITEPGDVWTFLGFKYYRGEIDISDITMLKMKGKISRAARKLYRERVNRGLTLEKALSFMIKKFNRKFYGTISDDNIFSWARWFFPLINTDESLKYIDLFMQEKIRYIATGKHRKINFKKVTYKKLREKGYIPLTSAFYLYRQDYNKYIERVTAADIRGKYVSE